MKKLIGTVAAAAVVLMASSCTTVTPGWGDSNGFTLISFGGKTGSEFVANLTENGAAISSTKIGEASSSFLFGAIPLTNGGDITLATAMKNGEITKVNTVETKTVNYLNIIIKKTTIVSGE